MESSLLEFTDDNFETEVIESSVPVVVDFYAEWCGPCHVLVKALETIRDEMGGNIKVGKVDIEKTSSLTGKYNVENIPSVLLFKNGEVVGRKTGSQTVESLKDLLGE